MMASLSNPLAPFGRLQKALRHPLVSNGYSLIASVGLTSVLGLAYWLVAARLYSMEEVGLNAALISMMTLVSAFAQLNLGGVLTRFLPTAGAAAHRWILGSYLLGSAASLAGCAIFFLGVNIWTPTLSFVAEPSWAVWFVAGTVIWTLFSLQDGALTGLRRAIWIPVKNALYGIAKIVLLVLLAYTSIRPFGLFASWTMPLVVVVIVISFLILSKSAPALQPDTTPREQVGPRAAANYLGMDFLGNLFLLGAGGGASILVLEVLGAESSAVYYLAWTIAYTLKLLSMAMSSSLTAEAAFDRGSLNGLASRALLHTMSLLAIGVAALVIGAPLILAFFGPAYQEEGTILLRILALSTLPFGYTSTYVAVARVERRMIVVAAVPGAIMVLVLGLGFLLLDRFGTIGIAYAWLIAQTTVAAGLLLFDGQRLSWRRNAQAVS